MKKQSTIFAPGEGPYMEKDIQLPGEDYAIDINQQLSEKDVDIGGEMSKPEYNIIGILLPYGQNEMIFKIKIPELKKVKAQENKEEKKSKVDEIFDYIVNYFMGYKESIKRSKYVIPSERVINYLAGNLFAFFPQYSKGELEYVIGLVGDLFENKYKNDYEIMRNNLYKVNDFFDRFIEDLNKLRSDYQNYLVNKVKKNITFKYDQQEVKKILESIQKVKDLYQKAVDVNNRLKTLEAMVDDVKEVVFDEDRRIKELEEFLKDIYLIGTITAKEIGRVTEINNKLTNKKQILHDLYGKITEIIAMFENKILNRITIDVEEKVKGQIDFVFTEDITEVAGEKPVAKTPYLLAYKELGEELYKYHFTLDQFKKILGEDKELVEILDAIKDKNKRNDKKIKTVVVNLKQNISLIVQFIDAVLNHLDVMIKDPNNKAKIMQIEEIKKKLIEIKEKYTMKKTANDESVFKIEEEIMNELANKINEIINQANINEYLDGVEEMIELISKFNEKGVALCKKMKEIIQSVGELDTEEELEIPSEFFATPVFATAAENSYNRLNKISTNNIPTTKMAVLTREEVKEIYDTVERVYQYKGELSKEMLEDLWTSVEKGFDLIGELRDKINNILSNMKEGDTINVNDFKNLVINYYKQIVSIFEEATGAKAFATIYKMTDKLLKILREDLGKSIDKIINESFLPSLEVEKLSGELKEAVKILEENFKGFGLEELYVFPPSGEGAVFTFRGVEPVVDELRSWFKRVEYAIKDMKELRPKKEALLNKLNSIAKKINTETESLIRIFRYYKDITKIKSPEEVFQILKNLRNKTQQYLNYYDEIEKLQEVLNIESNPQKIQSLENEIKTKKEDYFGGEIAYAIFKKNVDKHVQIIQIIDSLLNNYNPEQVHKILEENEELKNKILSAVELPKAIKDKIENIISQLKSPDITKKAEKIVFDNPFVEFDLSDKTIEEVVKNGKKKIVITKKKKKVTANQIDEFEEGEEIKYLDNDKLIDAVIVSKVSNNEYYISTFDSIKKVSKDLIFKLEEEEYATGF